MRVEDGVKRRLTLVKRPRARDARGVHRLLEKEDDDVVVDDDDGRAARATTADDIPLRLIYVYAFKRVTCACARASGVGLCSCCRADKQQLCFLHFLRTLGGRV